MLQLILSLKCPSLDCPLYTYMLALYITMVSHMKARNTLAVTVCTILICLSQMVQSDWSLRGQLFLIDTSQTFYGGLLLIMRTDLTRDRKTAVYKRKLYIATAECTVRYCIKYESRPDFVAVKGLVDQHTVSYRCSGASLVQALCFRHSLIALFF